MKRKLLEYLKQLDPKEEELIQAGENFVAKYTKQGSTLVDSEKTIRQGAMIDIMKQPRFVEIPEHEHNYIEIVYMFSGSSTHIMNKTTKVKLEADDMLILKQGTSHSVSAAGYNDIAIRIMILPAFLQYPLSMLNEDTVLRRFIQSAAENKSTDKKFLHFHLQDLPDAQNLLENMARSLLDRQRNSRRILQATMGVLLLELSNRTYKITVGAPSSYESQIVLEAMTYIEEHYQTATLEQFCKKHKMPPYQVSRLVKQYSPYTFTKYLQRRRMLQAAHLLTETDRPVEQIVIDVGYENSSHFHKLFKEEYGMTPKKYRDHFGEFGVEKE